MYASSKGSLIGVLNLTIDSAPTKPNDRAKELLTTVITKVVIKAMEIKVLTFPGTEKQKGNNAHNAK